VKLLEKALHGKVLSKGFQSWKQTMLSVKYWI